MPTEEYETLCHLGGMDVARTRDFTALAIGAIIHTEQPIRVRVQPDPNQEPRFMDISNRLLLKRLRVWDHMAYPIIAQDVKQEIRQYSTFLKLGIDATSEVALAEFIQRSGVPVEPLKYTQQLKHEMVTDLRFFMANKLFILPKSAKGGSLERELKAQELVSKGTASPKYDKPSGTHDDRFQATAILNHIAKPRLLGMVDLGVYRI